MKKIGLKPRENSLGKITDLNKKGTAFVPFSFLPLIE